MYIRSSTRYEVLFTSLCFSVFLRVFGLYPSFCCSVCLCAVTIQPLMFRCVVNGRNTSSVLLKEVCQEYYPVCLLTRSQKECIHIYAAINQVNGFSNAVLLSFVSRNQFSYRAVVQIMGNNDEGRESINLSLCPSNTS